MDRERWSRGIHRSAKLVGIAILAMTARATAEWGFYGTVARADVWSIGLLAMLLVTLWLADLAVRPAAR